MPKKIVIVQTIFCPTKKMLNFQLSSLKSFSEYLDCNPQMDAEIIFAGFVEDEYYSELIAAIKKYFYKKCSFTRFEKNYGKAYVVNTVLKGYLENNNTTKYIFTFDSDICFYTDQGNIIQRLQNIFQVNKAIGLIACNFTGDNAHWISKFEDRASFNGEEVVSPVAPVGIAGGCIMVLAEAWKKIGGYRIMGVYAPDDAMLMQDLFRFEYFIGVAKNILVHHPGTHDDPHYQNWKQKTSANIKEYNEALNYCEDFWNKTKTMEEGVTKLDLLDVTLAIVDCVDIERAVKAINYSTKEVNFGKIKLLTSIKTDYANAVKIPEIKSKEEYSKFCIKELNRYVDTKYVLLIQFDGFVIGGKKAWKKDFLDYDYIGAPWNYYDGYNVGNGGFSLRSKKLLKLLSEDNTINEYHPEDNLIGRKYRPYLEANGIKFSPEELAWKFAIECGNKYGWNYKGQFGFHGFDVINHNKIKL